MEKFKKENGSVTMFVLISMLFILGIGLIIFTTNMNSKSAQERNYKKIQQEYNNVGDLNVVYENQKILNNN